MSKTNETRKKFTAVISQHHGAKLLKIEKEHHLGLWNWTVPNRRLRQLKPLSNGRDKKEWKEHPGKGLRYVSLRHSKLLDEIRLWDRGTLQE